MFCCKAKCWKCLLFEARYRTVSCVARQQKEVYPVLLDNMRELCLVLLDNITKLLCVAK